MEQPKEEPEVKVAENLESDEKIKPEEEIKKEEETKIDAEKEQEKIEEPPLKQEEEVNKKEEEQNKPDEQSEQSLEESKEDEKDVEKEEHEEDEIPEDISNMNISEVLKINQNSVDFGQVFPGQIVEETIIILNNSERTKMHFKIKVNCLSREFDELDEYVYSMRRPV